MFLSTGTPATAKTAHAMINFSFAIIKDGKMSSLERKTQDSVTLHSPRRNNTHPTPLQLYGNCYVNARPKIYFKGGEDSQRAG